MASDLQKVKSGDPLRIKADTWNTMIDAARAIADQRVRMVAPPAGGTPGRSVLYIRNDSGEDLDWGDVLGIAGPLITPDENETDYRLWTALMGDTPDAAVHRGRFAVLTEPIPAGAIGHAVVTGVIATRVQMNVAGHRFADVLDNDATQLDSAESGSAEILWAATPEGALPETVSAIVRIGTTETAPVDARVSASEAIPATTNRWYYTCIEQELTETGWADKSGGRTFTECLYAGEAYNDGSGVQGNGVDIDGEDFPAGMSLQPIQGSPVVHLWPCRLVVDGSTVVSWRFYGVVNAIDGTCD